MTRSAFISSAHPTANGYIRVLVAPIVGDPDELRTKTWTADLTEGEATHLVTQLREALTRHNIGDPT